MNNRLTDEEWHDLIDSDPPELMDWISDLLNPSAGTGATYTESLVLLSKDE